MEKIVCSIKPFTLTQMVYVYNENGLLEGAPSTIDNLGNTIMALANKYNIQKVDLTGPKMFLNGISKKIKKEEFTKYSNNTLDIHII